MNIWFTGTGSFAALCLEGFTKRNVTFTRIITGLPTRSGRNGKENPSAVELKASSLGLNVTRTGKLTENHELTNALESEKPDVIFVIDFGQIIREPFLSSPKYGCLNIHPSMLPDLRGAAPVQRALMKGYTKTGVTVFRLVKAMDAGDILSQREIEIAHDENASDLYVRLSDIGSELAADVLNHIDEITFTSQNESLASYAPKIGKSEFALSFDMPAQKIINTARALTMSGGAYVTIRNKRVKLWRVSLREDVRDHECGHVMFNGGLIVSCADYGIELEEVQSEGKSVMSGIEWSRGLRLKDGDVLNCV